MSTNHLFDHSAGFLAMPFLRCFLFFLILLGSLSTAHAQEKMTADAYAAATTRMELRLSAVEDQMRILTGKFEQLDYAINRLDKTLQRLQSDYDVRITNLEKRPIPQPTPSRTEKKEALEKIKAQEAEYLEGEEKEESEDLSVQEQYDRAFSLLRRADFSAAEDAFSDFIKRNPKDKLVENAKYWHAETFYVRNRFGDAAIAFADTYEHNPEGTKAPDSLLKLAMSLAAINRKEDACRTLDALKSKYPKAPMTIRTRTDQERERLKCK
jgi:tol-pal system protein YbgF